MADYITALAKSQPPIDGIDAAAVELTGWRATKTDTHKLSRLYERASMPDYSKRAAWCCTSLQFAANPATDTRKLIGGNFCQLRLCPICAQRKARRNAHDVSRVLDRVDELHPDTQYLFLTLTIRNCEMSADALSEAITHLTSSWSRLLRQREITRHIKGWFRGIEITVGSDNCSYHPHIHAILAVDKSYFGGNMITDYRERWRNAARLDYEPSIKVNAITGNKCGDVRKETLEAAKYPTKPTDYLKTAAYDPSKVVADYTIALHKRRLLGYGGWLKDATRELKLDLERSDLVHIGDDDLRNDILTVVEYYHWDFGQCKYILTNIEPIPDAPQ